MITQLTLSNLKGVTRTIELAAINLVVGPNSSGKTAIIDGLKLALLGYHCRLGKKHSLTWNLASPDATMMTVATNERTISWKKSAKGAISVEGLEGLGDMPTVMLDLQEWLALSGPAKIQYVIEHSGQTLGDQVSKVEELVAKLPRVKADAAKLDRVDSARFLRELMVVAKANRKTAEVELDTIQGAINQNLLGETQALANPEKELKALTAEIQGIQQRQATALVLKQTLEKQLENEQRKIAKLGVPEVPVSALEEELTKLKAEATLFEEQVSAMEARLRELRAKSTADAKTIAIKLSEQKQLAEMIITASQGLCESCGSKIPKEHVQKLQAGVEPLEKEIAVRLAEHEETVLSDDDLSMDLQGAIEEMKRREYRLNWIEANMLGIKSRVAAVEEAQAAVKDLTEKLRQNDLTNAAVLDPAKLERKTVLEQQFKEYLAWKGTERERAKALEQRTEKDKVFELSKELITVIKAAEENLLQKVIGPLLERANALINRVLGKDLGYTDGEFTLGAAVLATLSGSEELVVFSGLQLALTPSLKERMLIVDELGRLDPNRFEKFIQTVDALIKLGTISSFIGVLPGEAGGELETDIDINIIECGGVK